MPVKLNAFRGIRSSKFRHVYGKAARKENCYENVLITQKVHDTAACAVNPKFIAIVVEVAGGGAFIVLPLDKTGRIDVTTPKVAGHAGPIYDIKWCPFNDNLIASCSDDCTIKLWHIPDGGIKATTSEPLVDLQEHQRRVTHLEWHPTVDGVLFSVGYDFLIIVWDVNHGKMIRSINVHSDIIYSISINRNGSRIATTSRDKKLRIIEPRTGKLLEEAICHEGPKACKAVYLGDTGMILTTGFSRYSDRQLAVWDERNLSSHLKMDTIDSSSGVLTPYYDHDTRLVFIAGKGDGNIRYYEITDSLPFCHYLDQYISSEPQRGFGVMPKRGCQVMKCEVFRFYKLLATKSFCEPISMIVPRKSDQFQPDLYPDTASPTPALSLEEWLTGVNKNPVLMSMKTGMTIKTHRPVPMRPGDMTSDKNAEKKFAFLTMETRADYRPLEILKKQKQKLRKVCNKSVDHHRSLGQITDLIDSDIRETFDDEFNNDLTDISDSFTKDTDDWSRNLNASDKDIKTSTNLDTKFQQLQRIWGCNVPSKNLNNSKCQRIDDAILSPDCYSNCKFSEGERSNRNSAIINKLDIKAYEESPKTISLNRYHEKEIEIIDKPTPKSEAELKRAYVSQCEEIKLLRRQLVSKDRKIRELEDLLNQLKNRH
ncbi:Coronin-2B [Armadillidium nasatum]|uniref:Coronin n=1 Tax=Armadillidium nasatum TaxID=96803 RepID=A0A5N5TPG7_9CRUS|nr:Coronin-2B [Armadillidium nasatum]